MKSLIAAVLLASAISGFAAPAPANPVYPRPALVPLSGEVLPLGDGWRSRNDPQGEFWRNDADVTSWTRVPAGRGGRRGGGGGGSALTAYRFDATIPAGWEEKRVVVRFDGVAHAAKLYVNGEHVRDHWGSLVPWSADITDRIKPGAPAAIVLAVDESPLGLARFIRGGGLQREAYLMGLPRNYISRLQVETDFDDDYRNAKLKVHLTGAINAGDAMSVRLQLTDKDGKIVPLETSVFELTRSAPDQILEVPVASPAHWDAEHPVLYELSASVGDAGTTPSQSVARKIGFREVEVRGNRMFVNGKEIKLRGVWGGAGVAALKAMNVNHTRQKWVAQEFLDDADRLGMYVLVENPTDFAKYGAESAPEFADQWLNMTADMLERDFSRPSVIMWGTANETFTGANSLKAFKYIQAEDAQRPVMHSWANRVPTTEELPYSIYSSHYPDLNDPNLDMGAYTVAKWHSTSLIEDRNPRPSMPVLHDEYAHTINNSLPDRDLNVRNFWGGSVYRYWEKIFTTPGALGGDIFGLQGFGAGGTEAYLTKKGYSPVRIPDQQPLQNPGAGKPLDIPVKNWYDHTNLAEIEVGWSVGDEKGTMAGPDLKPHDEGKLTLPRRNWKNGDTINLEFTDAAGFKVDQFKLVVEPPRPALPEPRGPTPRLEETPGEFVVTGPDFKVVVDKYKGSISNVSYNGKTAIIDGPFIDLLGSGLAYSEWWCDSISAKREDKEVVIDIVGNYAVIRGRFELRIDGAGLLTTRYTLDHIPGSPPPATFSPWNATSVGGYSEVGVSYTLPAGNSSLAWRRKGLWSVYPEDHIGRNVGSAASTADEFYATKENIYEATVQSADGAPLTVLSDGRDAVRLSESGAERSQATGLRLGIHNEWNYPDFGLGNYVKPPILVKDGYSNTVYLRLGPPKR